MDKITTNKTMPIKQTTPNSEIDAYIDRELSRKLASLVYKMSWVGDQAVNAARNWGAQSNPYKDQTGNLRSSIGFVLVHNGNIVQMSSFNQVLNGSQGASDGRGYAQELAAKYRKGIILIVVAGMEYAKYVANTGRDVLDSAELTAERLVPQILKDLGFKI